MASTPGQTLPELVTRPPAAIPSRTGRRPWSTQLLREWAAVKYPGVVLLEQVRLGPTVATLAGVQVTPALEAALRVENWYVDGVLITPAEVLMIESKVPADPRAVGQILFYMRLGFSTPQLAQYMSIPFVPLVLFAENDAEVTQFARQLGCRVEIYTPVWIADYLVQVQFRRRTTV